MTFFIMAMLYVLSIKSRKCRFLASKILYLFGIPSKIALLFVLRSLNESRPQNSLFVDEIGCITSGADEWRGSTSGAGDYSVKVTV